MFSFANEMTSTVVAIVMGIDNIDVAEALFGQWKRAIIVSEMLFRKCVA